MNALVPASNILGILDTSIPSVRNTVNNPMTSDTRREMMNLTFVLVTRVLTISMNGGSIKPTTADIASGDISLK